MSNQTNNQNQQNNQNQNNQQQNNNNQGVVNAVKETAGSAFHTVHSALTATENVAMNTVDVLTGNQNNKNQRSNQGNQQNTNQQDTNQQ